MIFRMSLNSGLPNILVRVFDFCKRQLRCLYPDLDILEIKINAQQLEAEEEERKKEKKEEENKEKGKKKGNTSPLSP